MRANGQWYSYIAVSKKVHCDPVGNGTDRALRQRHYANPNPNPSSATQWFLAKNHWVPVLDDRYIVEFRNWTIYRSSSYSELHLSIFNNRYCWSAVTWRCCLFTGSYLLFDTWHKPLSHVRDQWTRIGWQQLQHLPHVVVNAAVVAQSYAGHGRRRRYALHTGLLVQRFHSCTVTNNHLST